MVKAVPWNVTVETMLYVTMSMAVYVWRALKTLMEFVKILTSVSINHALRLPPVMVSHPQVHSAVLVHLEGNMILMQMSVQVGKTQIPFLL